MLQRSVLVVTTAFLLSLSICGQDMSAAFRRDMWKLKADQTTSALLKDASNAEPFKRALIYARMGEMWWSLEPEQSDEWFEKAVDTIIYRLNDNDGSENDALLQTSREILRLISDRNDKQTKRLIKFLSETDRFSEKDKNTNADTLIEYALLMVKEHPDKAYEIGALSFKVGKPANFEKLYWELRRYAPTLADNFFNIVFTVAASSHDLRIIAGLKAAVFPELMFPNAPAQILSPNPIKVRTLTFFADHITHLFLSYSGKLIPSCESEAFLFAPLKPLVNSLISQKATIFEQAIGGCLADKGKAAQDLAGRTLQNSGDIDELLKFADEAKGDLQARTYYLFRAATLANTKKRYKLAIEILENMTKEERETDQAFWDELRYTVAAGWAYQQFQEQDINGARLTLDRVQERNRAFAKIGFALQFSPKDTGSREFVLEVVRETRSELAKMKREFVEKARSWFAAVKIYSNYQMPTEAAETFREIVKDLNTATADAGNEKEGTPFIAPEIVKTSVSPDLIELRGDSLFESAGMIQDGPSRIEVNFAFLENILKEYDLYRKEADKDETLRNRTEK